MIGSAALVALAVTSVGAAPITIDQTTANPTKPAVHPLVRQQLSEVPIAAAGNSTVCQGNWQGATSVAYLDWLTGLEGYFSYQDPTEVGCTNTYPFGVISVIWPLYVRQPTEIRVYPAITDLEPDSLPCTYPGLPISIGASTVFQLNDTGFTSIEVFLPDTVCVSGPYFAAIVVDTFLDVGLVDIVVDSGMTPRTCASYNDFGHSPNDLITVSGFTDNLKLWSRGVNADQNQCFCCTGGRGNIDCDPQHQIDISDLSRLIDNLFISFAPLCCVQEANCDGDAGVDISDLSALIDFLYISFTPLPPC
jgi:hypothetical protein